MTKSPTWQWPASITLLERMTPSPSRQSCATWELARNDAARRRRRLAAAARGARVHRHALADQAFLADDQRHRLAAVFEVLRLMADRGEREDARARADVRVAGDDDMGVQLARRRRALPARPTWQNGPISTPGAQPAPSSTTALG